MRHFSEGRGPTTTTQRGTMHAKQLLTGLCLLAAPLVAAPLATLSLPLAASAQRAAVEDTAASSSSVLSPTRRWRYLEGHTERVIAQDASGALWLELGARRIPTAIGTDRVVLIGAHDPALWEARGLVLDEVLGARAGIVAVRSIRPDEHALELAARLATDVRAGVFEAASPDLAFAHERRDISVPPNDPRFGGQWFYETIRLRDAWRREDGQPSVTIAVVDNGCDLAHPDLVPKLLGGYDALEDDDDPSYLPGTSGNEHGTACAGLVAAATDNGIDVAGTCPECSLRCIRLLGAPGTLIPISSDVRAFEFVNDHEDIAVVSNSWGFAAGAPAPLALVRQIQTVMTSARGGRGALVVFAAGNDASVIGADEIQAIPGVLTVGAINTFDEAASFSNSGECVALVAPTGTLTTDISGAEGGAAGDVTTSFGGTSSACPIVAGVAGLLVSAAPELSASELHEAIVASVRRAPFATPDARGHDLLYGYGIVDPSAALDRVLGVDADAGVEAHDAGPIDAGVTADAGAAPPPDSGCACRAQSGGEGGLAALWGALALSGVCVRRRTRRKDR